MSEIAIAVVRLLAMKTALAEEEWASVEKVQPLRKAFQLADAYGASGG
jgi:hypothetical protein